jgi:hypothetical protein
MKVAAITSAAVLVAAIWIFTVRFLTGRNLLTDAWYAVTGFYYGPWYRWRVYGRVSHADRRERAVWGDWDTGTEGRLTLTEDDLPYLRDGSYYAADLVPLPREMSTDQFPRIETTDLPGRPEQIALPAGEHHPGDVDTLADVDHASLTAWIEAVTGGDPLDGCGSIDAYLDRLFRSLTVVTS